jgi:hypothetical protein
MAGKKRGRPPHQPDDTMRRQVERMTGLGMTQDAISQIVQLDEKTLRRYYRRELDVGAAKANMVIAGTLFQQAVNGGTAAAIFWMKCRGGWREKHVDDTPLTEITVNVRRAG